MKNKVKAGWEKFWQGERKAGSEYLQSARIEKSCSGWINGLVLRRAVFKRGFGQTVLMQSGSDCFVESAVHGLWCLNSNWTNPYKKYHAEKCYGISRDTWHR